MGNKSTKRPSSGAKSPMKAARSQQPAWVRTTIIIVAIAFIGISIPVVLLGAGGTKGGAGTDAGLERIKAAERVVNARPDDVDAAITLGRAYYDYAVALYEGGQQTAAIPYWLNAVVEYDKALKSRPTVGELLGNKAMALYYAWTAGGSDPVETAAALQAFIDNPNNAGLEQQASTAQQMLASIPAQPLQPSQPATGAVESTPTAP